MQTVILIIHMLAAVALIGLILLQQGKGADMGAAFGSGASSTVFGAQGSASFLTRGTAILATVFFLTSLTLGYFTNQGVSRKSVTETVVETVEEKAPVADDLPTAPGSTNDNGSDSDIPQPE